MRPEGPAERWTGWLLATLTVAFAAWTVAYHVAVVADLSTGVAAAGAVALSAIAGLVALRLDGGAPAQPRAEAADAAPPARRLAGAVLAGVTLAGGVAGAALTAFTDVAWPVAWVPLAVAAGAGVAVTLPTAAAGPTGAAERWPEVLVVLAWAAVCAAASLFINNPSGDDAHYAHLAAWVASQGEFPTRDVMLSPEVLPALYFPPVPAYEPFIGTLARGSGLSTGDLFYYAVPPAASVLAVLAGWRLLRRWGVPLPAVALTVAIVFLFFHTGEKRHLGEYFVGRLWQGKVLLLCIGIPVLWAMLVDYAARPGRRGPLLLLGCAGTAAVGLSTTAIFVLPVIAAGALAPLALRAPKAAVLGVLAASAYPVAAGVVTLKLGGRTPDEYGLADVQPRYLLDLVLGDGVPAFLALVALVGAPVLVPRLRTAPMLACSALLVVLLLAPGVPRLVFDLTGLGRVLWRLLWVVPLALALGALATSVAARWRPWPVRLLPAAAVAAAAIAGGGPVWSVPSAELVDRPVWKRNREVLAQARQVLRVVQPGDTVLGPVRFTQTLLIASGDLHAVNPRLFFIRPLRDDPRGEFGSRWFLLRMVTGQLEPPAGRAGLRARTATARSSLERLGVDLACVGTRYRTARAVLQGAGYAEVLRTARLVCYRP